MTEDVLELAKMYARAKAKEEITGIETGETEELGELIGLQLVMPDIISDCNVKWLKMKASQKEPLSKNDLFWLSRLAGKDDAGFSPAEWEGDDEGITDDMLKGYAEHLRNYLYTYKEEAKGIDPEIDPEEEHKGPMAQDIEKVAPDCVKETPEGVKTVDGNRLALVNAGVIGELSRRVLELEEKVNGKNT